MKILIFITLILTITNFLGIKALAQKDITPYVVNPLIGDTLTLEERDYYMLFPQIEGFQFAVFYLNPDSTLNADVKYLVESRSRDTLIQSYRSLKSLNYHICARNALENRTLDTFHPVYESPEYKEGSEVCAYMNDGRETSGELLLVRKNSLLILKTDCDDDLKNPDCISKINTSEIDRLFIEGNSNLGLGIGFGLLASVIVGALVFQSYNDGSFLWGYDAIVPTILSTVGCITLGVTIGIATSTPDEEIKTFSKYEISGLSTHSRYQSNEPNELIKIK
ncbi:MAG: hypothetical protein OEM46_07015 [Ignavibacteria bacterium]|nr:hypothetical protein [Ignavibacteria bacterium]